MDAARRRARRHATLAIGLLVATGYILRYGSTRGVFQETVVPWLIFALLLYAVGACLWWAAMAWRHPKPDPWAYDPELDGPVAEAMEGRSYLRGPDPEPAAPPLRTALLLGLALLFLLAGAWLVTVADHTWSGANGAEGPIVSALAFYLFAAAFLAAGPWLAWAGLRRAR